MKPTLEKKTGYILSLIFLQLVLSITVGILITFLPKDNKIMQNVFVNSVPIGGLTKEQAIDKITRRNQLIIGSERIPLVFNGKKWDIGFADIDLSYDYQRTVNKAYNIGRQGNIIKKLYVALDLRSKDMKIPLSLNYDKQKLAQELKKISFSINTPANNARINLQGDHIIMIREKNGYEVDIEKTIDLLNDVIGGQNYKIQGIVLRKVSPNVVAEDLKEIKDPLSISVTTVDLSNKNRTKNIIIATGILNGIVIKAGETFSFNKTLGPRLKEKGYKVAPVIDGGLLVPDIGGGVCQVSTTLYNSVLLAGLNVSERYPHSKPVSYIPIGQDAAVVEGKLDLKFVNGTTSPIAIIAYVDSDKLIIRTFGKQGKTKAGIKLVSENIQTLKPKVVVKEDANLNKGYSQVLNHGVKGYKAQVYRIWNENGKQHKKELISETEYNATNTVIRVGTRPTDIDLPK